MSTKRERADENKLTYQYPGGDGTVMETKAHITFLDARTGRQIQDRVPGAEEFIHEGVRLARSGSINWLYHYRPARRAARNYEKVTDTTDEGTEDRRYERQVEGRVAEVVKEDTQLKDAEANTWAPLVAAYHGTTV